MVMFLRRIFVYNRQTVIVNRRVARRDRAGIDGVTFDDGLVVASTDSDLIC